MIPKNRNPMHPGVILQEEFLDALGISQSDFAKHLGVSYQRINELINGKRGITADTAWLLSQAFGNSAEFWMNLQMTCDLARHRPERTIKRLPKMDVAPRKIRAKAS